jgi:hypothetical protein
MPLPLSQRRHLELGVQFVRSRSPQTLSRLLNSGPRAWRFQHSRKRQSQDCHLPCSVRAEQPLTGHFKIPRLSFLHAVSSLHAEQTECTAAICPRWGPGRAVDGLRPLQSTTSPRHFHTYIRQGKFPNNGPQRTEAMTKTDRAYHSVYGGAASTCSGQ